MNKTWLRKKGQTPSFRQRMTPPKPTKQKIGFIAKERAAKYKKAEIYPTGWEPRLRKGDKSPTIDAVA